MNEFTATILEIADFRVPFTSESGMRLFGRPENGSDYIISRNDVLASVDIVKGKNKISVFRQRGAIDKNSKAINGYNSMVNEIGLIKESRFITANDLNKRIPGEPQFNSSLSNEDRILYYASKIYVQNMTSIGQALEKVAWETAINGAIPDLGYDFERDSSLDVTVVNKWNTDTSNPIDDLTSLASEISKRSGYNPDMVVLSGDSYNAFIKNKKIIELGISRSLQLVKAGEGLTVPTSHQYIVDGGLNLVAKVIDNMGKELFLYVYDKNYIDENDDYVSFIPAKTVYMTSVEAQKSVVFGAPEIISDSYTQRVIQETFGISSQDMYNLDENQRFFVNSWLKTEAVNLACYRERETIELVTEVAPLFIPTQINANGVLRDVI